MGIVWDIKRFAIHDGPGIRTTVFFKGCPLQCQWCHNPESRDPRPTHAFRANRCLRCGQCVAACPEAAISTENGVPHRDQAACSDHHACADVCPTEARTIIGTDMTVNDVLENIRRDRVFYDRSGGGVTFSGGEPLMQPEFLGDLLTACRAESIHCALDTTGLTRPEVLASLARNVDLFLYDLKVIDAQRHLEYCGATNVPIQQNLIMLTAEGHRVIIRFPLIPGITDDSDNLDALGRFVADLPAACPIDVLPYQAMGVGKYAMVGIDYLLPDLEPPSELMIDRAVTHLRDFGLAITVRGRTP